MTDNEAAYNALTQAAYDKVLNYSTNLFAASPKRRLGFRPAGSGTFVRVGDRRCVLTAAHVWEALPHDDAEGDVALNDGRHAAITIPIQRLRCVHVTKRLEDPWGPDLALVEIPSEHAGRIEAAGKTFYDLNRRRADTLAAPDVSKSGLWLLVGAPAETTTTSSQRGDGAWPVRFDVIGVATSLRAVLTRNGFDYLEASLHDKRSPGFPSSYGGVSGGGLWHVGEEADGKLTWDGKTVTLEGVAFFHVVGDTPEEEAIRCHGRKSIYADLLGAPGVLS